MQINFQPEDIILSSQIPNEIPFESEGAHVELSISVQDSLSLETRLYVYDKSAVLSDARSVIEGAMRAQGNALAQVVIRATDDLGGSKSLSFLVVYSTFTLQDPAKFLTSSFLSSRSAFRISRSGKQVVYAILTPGTTESVSCVCAAESEGTVSTFKVELGSSSVKSTSLVQFAFSPEEMEATLHEKFPKSGNLLACTFYCGNRAMSFFMAEQLPEVVFSFRNAFNVVEYAEVEGVTVRKQEVQRSIAVCRGVSSFYDQNSEHINEVQTGPLSLEEATWLNQLLQSREVSVIYQDTEYPALITDLTSELSDADDAINSIKFAWKFAKPTAWLDQRTPTHIFTSPYNDTFA